MELHTKPRINTKIIYMFCIFIFRDFCKYIYMVLQFKDTHFCTRYRVQNGSGAHPASFQ
jgi:hypothetical protein